MSSSNPTSAKYILCQEISQNQSWGRSKDAEFKGDSNELTFANSIFQACEKVLFLFKTYVS